MNQSLLYGAAVGRAYIVSSLDTVQYNSLRREMCTRSSSTDIWPIDADLLPRPARHGVSNMLDPV